MGQLGIIETSIIKCRTTQPNTQKQRRPQVHGEGTLKTIKILS